MYHKSKIYLSIVFSLLIICSNNTLAAPFFADSFESGSLNYTANGARWANSEATSVTSERAHTGSRSLRFLFAANGTGDSWAEQRFDLGTRKNGVYIRFYIYFPTNYHHRNVSPNNNKLIRLWSDEANYSGDPIKIGASFESGSISRLFPEANKSYYSNHWEAQCSGSMGVIHSLPGLGTWELKSEDLGKWLCFEFHIKRDTGPGDGAFEFWVNGIKQFGTTNLTFNGAPCAPGYFKFGYLLGWSNSGFDQNVSIYIDDVAFSDTYIGPIGTASGPDSTSIIDYSYTK